MFSGQQPWKPHDSRPIILALGVRPSSVRNRHRRQLCTLRLCTVRSATRAPGRPSSLVESAFRIRIRNSLECASPSWALLQFTNHAVYDGPKLGRTTSPGTSISPASQAFCKPPSGGLLLIYIAVPPDHPGRAHGHPIRAFFQSTLTSPPRRHRTAAVTPRSPHIAIITSISSGPDPV